MNVAIRTVVLRRCWGPPAHASLRSLTTTPTMTASVKGRRSRASATGRGHRPPAKGNGRRSGHRSRASAVGQGHRPPVKGIGRRLGSSPHVSLDQSRRHREAREEVAPNSLVAATPPDLAVEAGALLAKTGDMHIRRQAALVVDTLPEEGPHFLAIAW